MFLSKLNDATVKEMSKGKEEKALPGNRPAKNDDKCNRQRPYNPRETSITRQKNGVLSSVFVG
jgi:hypothetical protein